MKHILTILLLACTLAGAAAADKWGPATLQEVVSSGKRFRAVVEPEKGSLKNGAILTLWELRDGSEKRRYQRRTVNRRSPVHMLVADNGTVVTLDDWLRAGYDHAVVIYAASGAVVRDSRLEDLLMGDDLEKVEQSVSSRRWYYPAEPPRIVANQLKLTAIWGPSVTIDLSTGAFSLGHDRFFNLVQFLNSDLTALDRVEYERWYTGTSIRCSWQKDETVCEGPRGSQRAVGPLRRMVPRAELRGRFQSVLELLDTVEAPSYCAVGCIDRAEVRFFFTEGGQEFSYSILMMDFSKQIRLRRDLFGKILRLLAFDGVGPGAGAVQPIGV